MEKKLDGKVIYDGRILKLELDSVLCENNMKSYREIIRHNGGAGVLCIKGNRVLLVKQFRYAYNELLYEIPAGKLEKNEDPMEAALRELEEETGYRALNVRYLTNIYPTCGYSDEKIYLYLVDDVVEAKTNLDADEFIETNWFDLNEVLEMIRNGLIRDAKTICAINLYLLNK